jgi:hypothetical protein
MLGWEVGVFEEARYGCVCVKKLRGGVKMPESERRRRRVVKMRRMRKKRK